jgi:hypothetical protein
MDLVTAKRRRVSNTQIGPDIRWQTSALGTMVPGWVTWFRVALGLVHVNGSLGGACVTVVAVISLSLSEQLLICSGPDTPFWSMLDTSRIFFEAILTPSGSVSVRNYPGLIDTVII